MDLTCVGTQKKKYKKIPQTIEREKKREREQKTKGKIQNGEEKRNLTAKL